MSALRHGLTCWMRGRITRRWQPIWRYDKVAQMFGIAQYGCPRCGRGAIEERDAQASR